MPWRTCRIGRTVQGLEPFQLGQLVDYRLKQLLGRPMEALLARVVTANVLRQRERVLLAYILLEQRTALLPLPCTEQTGTPCAGDVPATIAPIVEAAQKDLDGLIGHSLEFILEHGQRVAKPGEELRVVRGRTDKTQAKVVIPRILTLETAVCHQLRPLALGSRRPAYVWTFKVARVLMLIEWRLGRLG